MNIYIDENIAPRLAEGLDILQGPLNKSYKVQIKVLSIRKIFGEGTQDEEWIPKVGKEESCIITQDYRIHRISHQKELTSKYGLGMFYLRPPSKSGFSYWDITKLIVKHWEEIIKIIKKEQLPFEFKITTKSKKPEKI